MKKACITLFLIIFQSYFIQAQWSVQNVGNSQLLRCINFASPTTGWMTGNSGQILKTTNGGNDWSLQNSGTTNPLAQIFSVDTLTVYIASFGGYVLKTTDGGSTWNQIKTGSTSNLDCIFFINKNVGWVAGYNGTILKTTDSGTSWKILPVTTSTIFTSMFFTDSSHGVLGATQGKLFITTDGGQSWLDKSPGTIDWFFGVDFVSPTTGFVVGGITDQDQAIYKTTDRGITWTRKSTQSAKFLISVCHSDSLNVWSAGYDGVIMHSTDCGETWVSQNSNVTTELDWISWGPQSTGYAVGDNGTVLRYSNQPLLSLASPIGGETWQIGSTHNIKWYSYNVTSVKIYYSIDNGTTWTSIVDSIQAASGSYDWIVPNTPSVNCKIKITDVSNSNIYTVSPKVFSIPQPSLSLSSPVGNEIWGIGTVQRITWASNGVANIKIEYSTNTGVNWIVIADIISAVPGYYTWTIPNTPSGNCKIRITDAANPNLTISSSGEFTIPAPQPCNWEQQNIGTTQRLRCVNFANPTIGWITGDSGLVFKTTNGGDNWIRQNLGLTNPMPQIFSVDTLIAYIAVHGGSVLKTTNGGASWAQIWPGVSSNLTCLYFFNANDGWVAGYDGKIIKTTDGGNTWTIFPSITAETYTSIYFTDVNHGVLGGTNGKLTITTNGGQTWVDKSPGTSDWFFGVDFVSLTTGFTVGGFTEQDQAIYKTTNAGATWVRKTTPSNKFLISVCHTDTLNIWGSGYKGEVMHSMDGGETWVSFNSNVTSDLDWISMSPQNRGFSVGANGTVLRLINKPSLTLLSPIGGEGWLIGSSYQITWSDYLVTNLKIEYSTNSGSTWTLITASTPASSGSYVWKVPNTLSSTCKVRISDVSDSTIFAISNRTFSTIITGTDKNALAKPTSYELQQNYPNPFNPSTKINYVLPEAANVSIKVYDQLGQQVAELTNGAMDAGYHSVVWNAINHPTGVYFCVLKSEKFSSVKKLLLLK